MYYTYILKCNDNTLYTGYTNNLENRVKAHNEKKGAKYTKGRTPVKLIYYEQFNTKSQALKRESEIKKLPLKKKKELIKNKQSNSKKLNFLLINGPNINMLNIREKNIYGNTSYEDLILKIKNKAEKLNINISCFQSNHEGIIIDKIQEAYFKNIDGIIINPAAYSHTSIGILDALKAVNIPTVEVHISNIKEREPFRHFSYVSLYAEKTIIGKGINGYILAIEYLYKKLSNKKTT